LLVSCVPDSSDTSANEVKTCAALNRISVLVGLSEMANRWESKVSSSSAVLLPS
jgi:hypothetical protein